MDISCYRGGIFRDKKPQLQPQQLFSVKAAASAVPPSRASAPIPIAVPAAAPVPTEINATLSSAFPSAAASNVAAANPTVSAAPAVTDTLLPLL